MLEFIEVDGFKSLRKFSLLLKPGLNVLVGPNGSGKTNIISFFEFLGLLQTNNVSKAISAAGGAGSIFSKIGEQTYQSKIASRLIGNINISKKKWIYYEYSFTVSLSKTFDTVIYESQQIKCKKRTVHTIPNSLVKSFDLDIIRKTDSQLNSNITINCLEHKIIDSEIGFLGRSGSHNISDIKKRLEAIINESIDNSESILSILRYIIMAWYSINDDLQGGSVYNIEPSRCRVPEDAAKPPGIHKDGSGLYATLFALTQKEKQPGIRRRYYPFIRDELNPIKNVRLEKITEYIMLANHSIQKIDVMNNPFDNQLQVRVHIQNKDNSSSILPLIAMSDGTVKWICLVTILLTSSNVLSIEEPENYLHPLMQKEIVTIMRNVIGKKSVVLLSTHSETFINSSLPEEIVIVHFKDGATHACRPKNLDLIKDEINETGFGLGYYYLSGALTNE
ncbi:MAG: hypothetical protein C4539_17690 [Ignavibacteriales bacterium]|nr:MAG: hypothetical protein C4539_17690 [Ignavibacteriales bacterium]